MHMESNLTLAHVALLFVLILNWVLPYWIWTQEFIFFQLCHDFWSHFMKIKYASLMVLECCRIIQAEVWRNFAGAVWGISLTTNKSCWSSSFLRFHHGSQRKFCFKRLLREASNEPFLVQCYYCIRLFGAEKSIILFGWCHTWLRLWWHLLDMIFLSPTWPAF